MLSVLFAALLLPALQAQQGVQPPTAQISTNSFVSAGVASLRAGHPQEALTSLQQAIAADPQNAAANLLAASAEIALLQPAGAVRYGERALALQPGNWKVHTTLVTAYTMLGDTAHSDAERAILRAAHNNPALPEAHETNGFLLDLFQAGRYRVEAVEYFKPLGRFDTYYRFIVRNAAGAHVWTIEINSDPLNEASWAQAYPKQAAEGQRQFQIESAQGDVHVTYRTFSGTADYSACKAQVIQVLDAQATPFPGESPGR